MSVCSLSVGSAVVPHSVLGLSSSPTSHKLDILFVMDVASFAFHLDKSEEGCVVLASN